MNVSSAFVEFTFKTKVRVHSGQSGINKLLDKTKMKGKELAKEQQKEKEIGREKS